MAKSKKKTRGEKKSKALATVPEGEDPIDKTIREVVENISEEEVVYSNHGPDVETSGDETVLNNKIIVKANVHPRPRVDIVQPMGMEKRGKGVAYCVDIKDKNSHKTTERPNAPTSNRRGAQSDGVVPSLGNARLRALETTVESADESDDSYVEQTVVRPARRAIAARAPPPSPIS